MKLKNTLPFNLVIKEIPRSIIPVSATQVRNWIDTKNTENLKKYLSEKTLLSLGIPL
jgi:citrate lyase synthetase